MNKTRNGLQGSAHSCTDTGLFREGISSLLRQYTIEAVTHPKCRSSACHAAGKLQWLRTRHKRCLWKGGEQWAETTTPAVLHPCTRSIPPFSTQGVCPARLINEGTAVGFWAWCLPSLSPIPLGQSVQSCQERPAEGAETFLQALLGRRRHARVAQTPLSASFEAFMFCVIFMHSLSIS